MEDKENTNNKDNQINSEQAQNNIINEEIKESPGEEKKEEEKKELNTNEIKDDKVEKAKPENKILDDNKNNINNENKININEDGEGVNKINENKIIEKEDDKNKNEKKEKTVDFSKQQFEARNDDDKYLVKLEEDKELENIINEHNNNNNSSDEDDDDEEEETFPFRIIGDVQKKGETLGKFNHRYLEIDSVKGILKRYKSSKEYPRRPLEIIPLKNLKSLKKLVKDINKDCYDFEIAFSITKGSKTEEKTQIYRVRHAESRNKWYDSLLALWKHLVKNEKIPKINNHKLLFVDDQVGIIQDIKQHNDRSKVKTGKVTLRNFKILGILGVGGFSTVYKVQHIMTEKIYAMKVMNKNYIIFKKYLHYVVSEFEF